MSFLKRLGGSQWARGALLETARVCEAGHTHAGLPGCLSWVPYRSFPFVQGCQYHQHADELAPPRPSPAAGAATRHLSSARGLSATGLLHTDSQAGNLFTKVLVANRGEIAVRVMRTAKKLGIATVAVYSEADKDALHTRYADEAVCIGPPPAAQSYLQSQAIVEAARQTGSQAVHPGYGFLSENADFAEALQAGGIAFVGPPVSAIRAMGDKVESKRIACEAGVSTIPGWVGVVEDEAAAVEVARDVGFPVMLKASAGGGGKGMRIAWDETEVREGFRLSSQEASAAFGDDRMLIEKFIETPRHIEFQVLGDQHGKVVYLPERECSIQRRNQKVVEESPSTFLDAKTRASMGEQAVALCQAVGYHSAGTVEFLVDRHRNFYFLEMNTRLQVEHPITELVSGQDLVEHMFRVAAGQPLALNQHQAGSINGWAVEGRVYAEDPARGFLPSTGRLQQYAEPQGEGIRADSGVQEGSEISMFYDPLICKLASWGPTRDTALDRMCRALDTYVIRGVTHNTPFLRAVLVHPAFRSGAISTAFLADHFPQPGDAAPAALKLSAAQAQQLAAVVAVHHARREARLSGQGQQIAEQELVVSSSDGVQRLRLRPASLLLVGPEAAASGAIEVELEGRVMQVTDIPASTSAGAARRPYVPQLLQLLVDGSEVNAQVMEQRPRGIVIQFCGAQREVLVETPAVAELGQHMPPPRSIDTSKRVQSPMPGSLVSVAVQAGDAVEAGAELAVVEAMKMRNVLRAERSGVIAHVAVAAGAVLAADQVIMTFE